MSLRARSARNLTKEILRNFGVQDGISTAPDLWGMV